jgi:hypothetical protein
LVFCISVTPQTLQLLVGKITKMIFLMIIISLKNIYKEKNKELKQEEIKKDYPDVLGVPEILNLILGCSSSSSDVRSLNLLSKSVCFSFETCQTYFPWTIYNKVLEQIEVIGTKSLFCKFKLEIELCHLLSSYKDLLKKNDIMMTSWQVIFESVQMIENESERSDLLCLLVTKDKKEFDLILEEALKLDSCEVKHRVFVALAKVGADNEILITSECVFCQE